MVPFTLMRRLNDEFERMFEEVGFRRPFGLTAPEVRPIEWAPVIELLEKEGGFIVKAELPGLTKKDVKIELTQQLLTIQGERKVEKQEKKEGYFRTERVYGTFFRQIPLPEGVEIEKAVAVFKNGVLEIEVPVFAKKPLTGRRLEIAEIKEENKEKELVGV